MRFHFRFQSVATVSKLTINIILRPTLCTDHRQTDRADRQPDKRQYIKLATIARSAKIVKLLHFVLINEHNRPIACVCFVFPLQNALTAHFHEQNP